MSPGGRTVPDGLSGRCRGTLGSGPRGRALEPLPERLASPRSERKPLVASQILFALLNPTLTPALREDPPYSQIFDALVHAQDEDVEVVLIPEPEPGHDAHLAERFSSEGCAMSPCASRRTDRSVSRVRSTAPRASHALHWSRQSPGRGPSLTLVAVHVRNLPGDLDPGRVAH